MAAGTKEADLEERSCNVKTSVTGADDDAVFYKLIMLINC